jgi:hypothetical protein
MAIARFVVVASLAVWVALPSPPGAGASSLETCAQRVIRDWYAGGRVDGTYPFACYRAAIRALPDDVLNYSDADKDIARALEYARQGRSEPPRAASSSATPRASRAPTATKPQAAPATVTARRPATAPAARAPRPATTTGPSPARPPRPPGSGLHVAAAEQDTVGAGLPYPVLVLATLAAVLFACAGAGWALGRRR